MTLNNDMLEQFLPDTLH